MTEMPPFKTPVSVLQELCAQHNLIPQYKMISFGGAVHTPSFDFKVEINETLFATAQGTSKKKAKHAAAMSLLKKLLQPGGNFENKQVLRDLMALEELWQSHPTAKTAETIEEKGNPVGKLQEICMKCHWGIPLYTVLSETGPPHELLFEVSCKVKDYVNIGRGKTKKEAKRYAAKEMIKKLSLVYPNIEEQTVPPEQPITDNTTSLIEKVPNNTSGKISKASNPKRVLLESLNIFPVSLKQKDSVEFLEALAKENKFAIQFVPLHSKTIEDSFFYLVELLFSLPVICFGEGTTEDDAKEIAAYTALQYLKAKSLHLL